MTLTIFEIFQLIVTITHKKQHSLYPSINTSTHINCISYFIIRPTYNMICYYHDILVMTLNIPTIRLYCYNFTCIQYNLNYHLTYIQCDILLIFKYNQYDSVIISYTYIHYN